MSLNNIIYIIFNLIKDFYKNLKILFTKFIDKNLEPLSISFYGALKVRLRYKNRYTKAKYQVQKNRI